MALDRRARLAMTLAWLPALPALPLPGAAAAAAVAEAGVVAGRVRNAVTGQFLPNARVTVTGTEQVTFTDSAGEFLLTGLAPGPAALEVFYTDLDVQRVAVTVGAAGAVRVDVALTSVARYGTDPNVVRARPYIVASDKETDAAALAANEQRFAPNLKNVVATDSLGDILGSNVGEFLKLLPGVTGEYSGTEIIGVSIRGLGSGLTAFTANGAPVVSAFFVGGVAGGGRDFNINTMALNDVSRVEVTKVPTPATAADALAGSVNLISKSAFERSRAELRAGVSLAGSDENLTLRRTPHSNGDHLTRKALPGFDFDATLPVNKRFGVVVAGMRSDKFNEQHHSTMTFSGAGTATGASFARPYLQSYALIDSPRSQSRSTLSGKADWRVTPHGVLSLTSQWHRYRNWIGALTWTFSPGTVGTPTPASGGPFSFGDDFVVGAAGRGAVTMNGGGQTTGGGGRATSLQYRHDDGTWRIEAGLSDSTSEIYRRNLAGGHFGLVTASLIDPVRVSLLGFDAVRPAQLGTFGAANQAVDVYQLANYRITTANDTPVENQSAVRSGNFNLRRSLRALPFPAALQVGAARRSQSLDARRGNITWTFNGPDGNPATIENAAPYRMQNYVNEDSHYGFRNVPWLSPTGTWAAFQANPALFAQTAAQVVAAETFRVTNSEFIAETVTAAYVQAEVRLLHNRLRILTGVRREQTTDEGEGMLFDPNAVFVRNADGTYARTAQGARVRRPEAGAAGSLEELRLTRRERAYRANRSYHGFYPSLHLTYEVRDGLQARAAYARTYGRPDFTDIIPSATINELDLGAAPSADPSVAKGTITVRNTGLRPWTADNFDLSLEYYSDQGGMISGGVFWKEIRDFFGDDVRLATLADVEQAGLDARYVGWNLATKFNSGDARIQGAEINLRHPLRRLGGWGRFFTVFANATQLKLAGDQQASFSSFIPRSANGGFSFSRERVTLVAKWNHRGEDKRVAQPLFGPDGFEYFKARTTLDLNLAVQLSRRFSLLANANNVFNVPQTLLRYGSQTPAYARQWRRSEYGVALAVGLRGVF